MKPTYILINKQVLTVLCKLSTAGSLLCSVGYVINVLELLRWMDILLIVQIESCNIKAIVKEILVMQMHVVVRNTVYHWIGDILTPWEAAVLFLQTLLSICSALSALRDQHSALQLKRFELFLWRCSTCICITSGQTWSAVLHNSK